jgi:taurine dioxygenase
MESAMTYNIRPLSDALGAEITGINTRQPIGADDIAAIREAFLEFHLLCFRAAPVTAQEFCAFARHFGEPQKQLLRNKRDEAAPEVSILDSTYRHDTDKPDDQRMMRLTGWHTDDSYFAAPAKATMLQSIEIPRAGGQTRFLNTRKAYADLPATDKQRVDGLRAVHCYDTRRAPVPASARSTVENDETPDVTHPLIRTHEDTGVKSFYFNANRTDRIDGMAREESDALLDWVQEQIVQPQYHYEHEWRVGDMLLWDNRCLVHSVNMDFPVGQTRRHQRILLQGVRPV